MATPARNVLPKVPEKSIASSVVVAKGSSSVTALVAVTAAADSTSSARAGGVRALRNVGRAAESEATDSAAAGATNAKARTNRAIICGNFADFISYFCGRGG